MENAVLKNLGHMCLECRRETWTGDDNLCSVCTWRAVKLSMNAGRLSIKAVSALGTWRREELAEDMRKESGKERVGGPTLFMYWRQDGECSKSRVHLGLHGCPSV